MPYWHINMLPVPGTLDVDLSAMQAKKVMQDTLRILDGIRLQRGYTPGLNQHLDNARFHVAACFGFVDRFFRIGGDWRDPVSDIPEVASCIALYMTELDKAKRAWNELAIDEEVQRIPADIETPGPRLTPARMTLRPPTLGEAFGAAAFGQDDVSALKPKGIPQSLVLLGGALAIGGLIWLARRS